MMKRAAIAFVLITVTACCVAAYVLMHRSKEEPVQAGKHSLWNILTAGEQTQVGKCPLWDEFNYQQAPGPKEQQFVILRDVKTESANARGRVVFAMQDKLNY